ncbi:DUF1801 domain-containing protein [Micromonospora sediminicola]|uniref:DUF1801 domain-containing protein n=1 Tax=Micromonospora sediminicola TaxID=946078 RepID=UPI003402C733
MGPEHRGLRHLPLHLRERAHGDWPLVGFSPRKQQLVVYLVGGFEERYPSVLARLGPHKTGKGCLYLKRLDDVDESALRELVDRTVRVHRGVDRANER